jgi:hypothetical protein
MGGKTGCRWQQHAAQLSAGESLQAEMADKFVDHVVLDHLRHARFNISLLATLASVSACSSPSPVQWVPVGPKERAALAVVEEGRHGEPTENLTTTI